MSKMGKVRDYLAKHPDATAGTVTKACSVDKQTVYAVKCIINKERGQGPRAQYNSRDLVKDIAIIKEIGVDRVTKILELLNG